MDGYINPNIYVFHLMVTNFFSSKRPMHILMGAHFGINKTQHHLHHYLFFPIKKKKVNIFIQNRTICSTSKPPNHNMGLSQPLPSIPTHPWKSILLYFSSAIHTRTQCHNPIFFILFLFSKIVVSTPYNKELTI